MPSLSDGGGERLESSLPVPALHTVVTDVDVVLLESDREVNEDEIGRASCRERVFLSV